MSSGNRQIKGRIREFLGAADADWDLALDAVCQHPPRRSVNALISFFCDREELVRWRAIAAAGRVVAMLAQESMESARIIMRRLMWSLNDESGGIGWGAPEAMGEIMARERRLAKEFAHILRSYVRPDENFLEHETLQQGVLWGIGRLALIYPESLNQTDLHLWPFLASNDSVHRGYAAWALGNLKSVSSLDKIRALRDDPHPVAFFDGVRMIQVSVGCFAEQAIKQINGR